MGCTLHLNALLEKLQEKSKANLEVVSFVGSQEVRMDLQLCENVKGEAKEGAESWPFHMRLPRHQVINLKLFIIPSTVCPCDYYTPHAIRSAHWYGSSAPQNTVEIQGYNARACEKSNSS